VVDGAWERREAIRQLAELRRRLTAAEDALTEAHAAMKRVEAAFDAASDAFTEDKQAALDAAREQRARAREARYAAQQAHERAATAVARLQRRVTELSERLDRMTLPAWGERGVRGRHACGGPLLPRLDPPSDQRLVCPGGDAQLGHPPVMGRLGLPLAVAQRQARAFGQQVGPAARGLGQLGDRRGFLLAAEPPGGGEPGGGPGDPPVRVVSIRAGDISRAEHPFDSRQAPGVPAAWPGLMAPGQICNGSQAKAGGLRDGPLRPFLEGGWLPG
jgi:hypothetical protein